MECVKQLKTFTRMNQLRISYKHPDFNKDEILFNVELKSFGTGARTLQGMSC
jgi:hypothetical protein